MTCVFSVHGIRLISSFPRLCIFITFLLLLIASSACSVVKAHDTTFPSQLFTMPFGYLEANRQELISIRSKHELAFIVPSYCFSAINIFLRTYSLIMSAALHLSLNNHYVYRKRSPWQIPVKRKSSVPRDCCRY